MTTGRINQVANRFFCCGSREREERGEETRRETHHGETHSSSSLLSSSPSTTGECRGMHIRSSLEGDGQDTHTQQQSLISVLAL